MNALERSGNATTSVKNTSESEGRLKPRTFSLYSDLWKAVHPELKSGSLSCWKDKKSSDS